VPKGTPGGGVGLANAITGACVTYAGGGSKGGGVAIPGGGGAGGSGPTCGVGQAGGTNLGGGGGGSSYTAGCTGHPGGLGGPGVVIIREACGTGTPYNVAPGIWQMNTVYDYVKAGGWTS
jgi:hypothetical protein